MKRILIVLIALSLCALFSLVLISCEKHEHDFAKELSFDENFHWYPCNGDGCTTKDKIEEHTLKDIVSEDGKVIQKCDCGYELVDTAPAHECEFEAELTHNDNFHWYKCKTTGCTKRSEAQEHIFDAPEVVQEANLIKRTYTCGICDYSYTETTKIDSVIDNEVSWEQAFENLEFLNFAIEVHQTYNDQTHINYCEVTETAAYYHIQGSKEFYTTKNEDGTYTTYQRNSGDYTDDYSGFIKHPDTSDTFLKGAQTETVIDLSFADHFDKFTYNEETGSYTYDGTIETTAYRFDGTPYSNKMYCYNIEIKTADGKITYIYADYYFGAIEKDKSFNLKYMNIGLTEVKVPYKVIENATNSDPSISDNDN